MNSINTLNDILTAILPPIIAPYKAWIILALLANTYVIRPSLPPLKDNSSGWYVFLFNVLDRLSGSYFRAAHAPANLLPQYRQKVAARVPTLPAENQN